MVQQFRREIFRHVDDLPQGLPFQRIEEFEAFNNANADQFDNLVCIPNSVKSDTETHTL